MLPPLFWFISNNLAKCLQNLLNNIDSFVCIDWFSSVHLNSTGSNSFVRLTSIHRFYPGMNIMWINSFHFASIYHRCSNLLTHSLNPLEFLSIDTSILVFPSPFTQPLPSFYLTTHSRHSNSPFDGLPSIPPPSPLLFHLNHISIHSNGREWSMSLNQPSYLDGLSYPCFVLLFNSYRIWPNCTQSLIEY